MVRSATKQQALAGGKIGKLYLAKQKKVERAKRALDLAERSEAPNPGDQKGAEPPFLALPQRPEGVGKSGTGCIRQSVKFL